MTRTLTQRDLTRITTQIRSASLGGVLRQLPVKLRTRFPTTFAYLNAEIERTESAVYKACLAVCAAVNRLGISILD